MERWCGKLAIVTGASAGIGAAIARRLAESGIVVAGVAPDKERIDENAKKLQGRGKLCGFKIDVTKENEIIKGFQEISKKLGPIHILVNNAGILPYTSLIDGETDKWKQVLDVNILGLCLCTREAIKNMICNKVDGHIVHINSVVGHGVPIWKNMNLYPATKHAVTALTDSWRYELIENCLNIKVSSVSPGLVATEIFKAATFELPPNLKTAPTLNPEDIANGVVYAVGTPPHVQVKELTIKPMGETFI
ncbi:farnesol dehydrogenase-like [Agrilus planipennis]|uniref:Farnesol dehydrogenase-like n=1 Tax=Agrilus planipennis TaxID=224129 RepID=A0A1W4WN32_AGRPL|nr:farnesol dehydrogenase-like [Agrilus planipennis]